MHRFDTLSYLKDGNERQRKVYTVLSESIFPYLEKSSPVLAGTIPLEIDVEGSDLDVLCYVTEPNEFSSILTEHFSLLNGFTLCQTEINSVPTIIANFFCRGFEIEIFGQNVPVQEQNGYRHMIIEDAVLKQENEAFRDKIITLKEQGIKTEPAFALLLGLEGNAYDALLEYGKRLNII